MELNSSPLVTVCIPVYNHKKYIAEAITSIINQRYSNIELIIINDGSQDESDSVIRNYINDCQNRFIRFEYRNRLNKGLAYTLNECLEWAKGEYFTGSASDDIMLPNKVEVLVKALQDNPENGIVFGDAIFIDEFSNNCFVDKNHNITNSSRGFCRFLDFYIYTRKINYKDRRIFGSYESLIRGNYLPAMSYLVKTSLLRKVGGWRNDNSIEDWEMWLKLSKRDKFLFLDLPVAKYRVHSSNSTKILEIRKRIIKDSFKILKNEKKYLCSINMKSLYWERFVYHLLAIRKYYKLEFILDFIINIYNPYFWIHLCKKLINRFKKDENIYVFRVGNLGDSIVLIPAIKLIYNFYGKKMILIANEESKYIKVWDVLKYTNCFEYSIEYKLSDIKDLYYFVKKIRGNKNRKVLFYFHPGRNYLQALRDYVFFKLCGFKKIYGIYDSINIWKNSSKKAKTKILEKESDRYLKMVLKFLGIDIPENNIKFPIINIPDEIALKTNELLEKENLKNKLLIGIGFGSKMSAKRWGIDNYSLLMNNMSHLNNNIVFILFGSKDEFIYGEELKLKVSGEVFNMAGRLSIIESFSLLSKCKMLISNDTGVMHMGAAMGVKIIAVFSARGKVGKWYPMGENNFVFRKNVPCENCMLEICPRDNLCLNNIKVDEVFEIVRKILF
ncbi:MAG: glycosyltransferase [Elusimicrobia bacterium]|nr:glycosyltransferase [Elusimicrobiota bacterium]